MSEPGAASPLADPQAWLLFLRFGLVGALNTAFGYAVFAALVLTGAWPGVALVVANTAGFLFNFQTSRKLVFRAGGRRWRFAVLYCAVLALNWVALRLLHGFGFPPLSAQGLLVLPVAALSFLGQRIFVFSLPAERA